MINGKNQLQGKSIKDELQKYKFFIDVCNNCPSECENVAKAKLNEKDAAK
ncbi:MAG TPA: hypothetical protein VLZ83_06675 [Edaphocola sp.]|nr:hypothetical protein [Edaphocola sp.]